MKTQNALNLIEELLSAIRGDNESAIKLQVLISFSKNRANLGGFSSRKHTAHTSTKFIFTYRILTDDV
jgi:hypothetical protein